MVPQLPIQRSNIHHMDNNNMINESIITTGERNVVNHPTIKNKSKVSLNLQFKHYAVAFGSGFLGGVLASIVANLITNL